MLPLPYLKILFAQCSILLFIFNKKHINIHVIFRISIIVPFLAKYFHLFFLLKYYNLFENY